MATQYAFGKIVTNGLLLALDAADRNSYPGSGTTWTDLSGNGNNFTLFNGVGFSTAGGGSLTFNGTNQYAASVSNINLTSYNYVVVEIVYRSSVTTNVGIIFEHTANWNSNAGGLGLALNSDGNNNVANLNHTNHNTEVSRNYAVVNNLNWSNNVNLYSRIADSTGRLSYLNSNLLPFVATGGYQTSTVTTAGGSFANAIFYIGSRAGIGSFFSGDIGSIKIYGFKMDPTQILQNYNAQKARFGLK
jgi:hypothetical protein